MHLAARFGDAWHLVAQFRFTTAKDIEPQDYESFPSFRLSLALLICTKGLWGRGKAQKWSNLDMFRGPDPTGHPASLENRHDEGSVLMRFRGAVSGGGRLGRQMADILGTLEAVLGRPFALRLFMKKCTRQYATLLLGFRPPSRGRKFGSNLDNS